MNNSHIVNITAITEVFPEGQKCVGALLEYDSVLDEQVIGTDTFCAEGRTITDVFVCGDELENKAEKGRFVYLALSPEDKNARTYFPGNPFEGKGAQVVQPVLKVRQIREIPSENGRILPAEADRNNRVKNRLIDKFVQGSFEGLAYNLFIPENYDPVRKYPLVQFIHDAGVCSTDVNCTLAQGVGALVWMTPRAQQKHECFVLAPQFAPPSIVDDDWNVDHRLEVEKRLLEHIVSLYSIDEKRLYTTGQSMGCMSSMVLNIRYPDLFAASLFVAGQWDERVFQGSGLEKSKFWFINSQGDAKAFPGMNQILVTLEKEGAEIAREVWRAGETQEVYEEKARKLLDTGADIIYTTFEMDSIADGWHSDGGEHHVYTWRYAYTIDAIHDWMFAQHKD